MKKVNSILLSLMMLGAVGAAFAQTGNTAGNETESRTAVRSDAGVAPVIPSMFELIATGGLLDDTLVRNKPLAAAFESETVQTLANGTQLVRRVTTRIYRDSDGRTRREQIFHSNGTTPSPGEAAQTVSIYDPVAGYRYSINSAKHTADRYKLPSAPPQAAPFNDRIPLNVEILRNDDPTGVVRKYKLEPPRVEPLGKQPIAGIEAEGRRVTIKVPAGAIGNAEPVETIYETWIARDLRMLVKSVVRNPASGEHTLRLTTINRAEQPRSLFEVPAGYPISDMGVPRTDVTPPL
ncbi:MAG: DUF4412 domain-containing protein [Acidobacteria bacterium]|nr:DUF4412 domain-containing protein [Acidobacteriota bacterium]MCA1639361.1 DUF4412 domain-containing protein [Acidobacteriota bacterium]